MKPIEKRIAQLKEYITEEKASEKPDPLYIEDLELSIAALERQLPTVSEAGYTMVKKEDHA